MEAAFDFFFVVNMVKGSVALIIICVCLILIFQIRNYTLYVMGFIIFLLLLLAGCGLLVLGLSLT